MVDGPIYRYQAPEIDHALEVKRSAGRDDGYLDWSAADGRQLRTIIEAHHDPCPLRLL